MTHPLDARKEGAKLNLILALVTPMALAVAGLVCAVFTARTVAPESPNTILDVFREFLLRVSLLVLIPLVVFETPLRAAETLDSRAFAYASAYLVLGVFLIVVPLLLGLALRAVLGGEQPSVANVFAFGSFGGGNRGMFAVIAIGSVLDGGSVERFESYVTAFILIDLGNFLVLLTAVPLALRALAKRGARAEHDLLGPLRDHLLYFLPLLALVCSGAAYLLGMDSESLAGRTLEATRSFRHALLSFVAMLYILISLWRTRDDVRFTDIAIMGQMIALRVGLIGLLLLGVYGARDLLGVTRSDFHGFLGSPAPLAVAILLTCPPSSIVSMLLRNAGVYGESVERIERITAFWTALFVAGVIIFTIGIMLGRPPA